MQISVNRVRLIKAIERAAVEDKKRFARDTAAKAKSDKHNRAYYANRLEAYVRTVRRGGKILDGHDLARMLERKIDWQGTPGKLKNFDCLLAKLYLATDDVLKIDDKSEYFSFVKCVC